MGCFLVAYGIACQLPAQPQRAPPNLLSEPRENKIPHMKHPFGQEMAVFPVYTRIAEPPHRWQNTEVTLRDPHPPRPGSFTAFLLPSIVVGVEGVVSLLVVAPQHCHPGRLQETDRNAAVL